MKFEFSDNDDFLITKLSKVGLISEILLFDPNLQISEDYPSKEKMLRGVILNLFWIGAKVKNFEIKLPLKSKRKKSAKCAMLMHQNSGPYYNSKTFDLSHFET